MGETVLVVDDDDDVRSLYRRLLTKRGYCVIEATTVEQAFDRLEQDPHAVVLDLELPDGSGTAVLDALSRDAKAPPVVVCTSSDLGARVGSRYHIAALGKLELTAIGNEVDRMIAAGRRPRLSRTSRTSLPSRTSRTSPTSRSSRGSWSRPSFT